MTDPQAPLFAAPGRPAGAIESAAVRTLAKLRERQTLDADADALTEALVLALARAVDQGLAAPKLSIATTTMARELRELVNRLSDTDAGTAGTVPTWLSDWAAEHPPAPIEPGGQR